ncbi:MAG: T9SS type A sorting domain-containing protein [Ignavibacteria bacterium]
MNSNKMLKKAVEIILTGLVMLSFNSSSAQWISQYLPPREGMILSIDFRNDNVGIIGGWNFLDDVKGKSFYTSNGGNNWHLSELPASVRAIVDIKFISDSVAYAVGSYNELLDINDYNSLKENLNSINNIYGISSMTGKTFYKGVILKTTNAGRSWLVHGNIFDAYSYLYEIAFSGTQKAFIVGSDQDFNTFTPKMSKSINGGNNWNELKLPVDSGNLSAIQCVEGKIFAAGHEKDFIYNGVILSSVNEGSEWLKTVFSDLDGFTDIKFSNNSTGYASGFDTTRQSLPNSTIYKTTNAGMNWHPINLILDSIIIQGIGVCRNTGSVTIFGNKTIKSEFGFNYNECIAYRSSDYGVSWTSQYISIPESGFLTCSVFLDPYKGYLAGAYGYNKKLTVYIDPYVFHTTNGGSTFVNNTSTNTPNTFYLSQNFPNPFNPSTTINYNLPSLTFVSIKVFDIAGKEILTLVDKKQPAGNFNVLFDGKDLSSGVYFYRLSTDNGFAQTKKMFLTK